MPDKNLKDTSFCDWCAMPEDLQELDTVVYRDHFGTPSKFRCAHICRKCAALYNDFVASRDDA